MAVEDPAITIPVLASLDLAETERFYRDALGFAVDRIDDYLIAKRDRMEIHFWLAADRIHPEHTSCSSAAGRSARSTRSIARRAYPRFPISPCVRGT